MRRFFSLTTIFMLIFGIFQINLAQSHFTGRFSAAQQTHTVDNDSASGTASCILTDDGLYFYLSVDQLSGPITAAHFHNGAMGENGPVVRTITSEFTGTTAAGLWSSSDGEPLTDALIAALFDGDLYLNVHTAANAAGEVRAQVIHSSGAGFSALLTEDQQTHNVAAGDPIATASLSLTEAGLVFKLTADGLTGPITAAHFHRGAAGVDGPVVRTITGDLDGASASGIWRRTDSEPLSDELIADLFAGNLYLNIHTAANAAGEIRGQVNLNGGWGFTAALDTTQQNQPVSNAAFGTATLTLTDAGLAFKITAEGLSGPIAAAHFHNAPAGQNGPVVRTITGEFDGNTATGLWTANDSEPLTTELIQALINGNLYLNIHTAANQAGEIRGQVLPDNGVSLGARLTAEQQTHLVSSMAKGTAYCSLTDAGLAFRVSVDGLSGPITAAHFHNGAMGKDGPVVRTITADLTGNTAEGLWTSGDAEPLTDALIRELLAGNLYLNVHTAANPPGEIRGQVLLSSGTNLTTQMTDAQQTHDVTNPDGRGTAAATLTHAGVAYNLTVTGLTGEVTAAHFHNGPAGENGPVVRTITDEFSDNFAAGLWTANDTEPLTDALITDLLTGNLYLNAHTAANAPGEIRGQLFVSNGSGMTARLDADQETHGVTSDAMGTAALTLTNAGLIFDMSLEGLSGPVTASHFHNAPAGMDGGVVRTITGELDGSTASGVWRSSDAEPLTTALLNELIAGNIYLNAHTAANPPGEIRGQVIPRDVITGIEPIDLGGKIPAEFQLAQNYPNPFNPSTTIEFSLSKQTFVQLTIFNALGQQVAVLVNKEMPAGAFKATFDAGDFTSGIYFYRLDTGGFQQTRKMLLIR